MKMRKYICAVVALGALLLGGCSSQRTPDVVVAKCWTELAAGNVKEALTMVNIGAGEEAIYAEMFAERAAKLREVGGVERVDIYSYDAGKTEAKVTATVVLANGRTIPATYTLTKVKRAWKIEN
ncbi:MAG: DUF4878 domain-containing protein [Tidjanibacter sp.]|nr:DUF4878 domain-containing protein [Tidjanibacter sp.]